MKKRYFIFFFLWVLFNNSLAVIDFQEDSEKREKILCILEDFKSIFYSLKTLYSEQINYFQKIEKIKEKREIFFNRINHDIFLIDKDHYLEIKKNKELFFQDLINYLESEKNHALIYFNKIQNNIAIFYQLTEEEIIFKISRMFNHFIKLRTNYLKYTFNLMREIKPYQIISFQDLIKNPIGYSEYTKFLLEEANLKYHTWEWVVIALSPYISEAYLDSEVLLKKEFDLYLKWILSKKNLPYLELLNPFEASYFSLLNFKYHEKNESENILLDLNQLNKELIQEEELKTELDFLLSLKIYDFLLLLKDYERIKEPDFEKRIQKESAIQQSRLNYPVSFKRLDFIKSKKEVYEQLPIEFKVYLNNQEDIKKEEKTFSKFKKNHQSYENEEISIQTKHTIKRIFKNEEQISWQDVEDAYIELKTKLEKQSFPMNQPLFFGKKIRVMTHQKKKNKFFFYELQGPTGYLLPKTIQSIQKAFLEFEWTPKKIK